jgi:hypothetical protein
LTDAKQKKLKHVIHALTLISAADNRGRR